MVDEAAGKEDDEDTLAGPSTDKKGAAKKQRQLRGRGAKRDRTVAGTSPANCALYHSRPASSLQVWNTF